MYKSLSTPFKDKLVEKVFGVSRTLKCADFILTRINEHHTAVD